MTVLLTYALFPLHFVIGLALAFWVVKSGGHFALWLALISVGTACVIAWAERIHPRYVAWNRSRQDVKTDVSHALVSMIALPPLLETALLAGIVLVAGYGDGDGTRGLWPDSWPLAAQLALALIVSQFFEYWFHRWSHEHGLLWRLHATHHSPKRLYWLNASRFHPLDTAGSLCVGMGSLFALGATESVIFMLTVWIAIHGMYQHCNIHLRLGPFNYIFSMAELHRWHHAVDPHDANHNYGNNIILWDLVLGHFSGRKIESRQR